MNTKLFSVYFKRTIRNKYFLITMLFLLLLLVNDRNSVFDQYEYKHELHQVRAEHAFYEKEIVRLKKEQNALFGSAKSLEKFAREKYLMKKDDEDVFVMVEVPEN